MFILSRSSADDERRHFDTIVDKDHSGDNLFTNTIRISGGGVLVNYLTKRASKNDRAPYLGNILRYCSLFW